MIDQPIVVGVDGSPESGVAAVVAGRLGSVTGARCQLVHATREVQSAFDLTGAGASFDDVELAQMGRVRADLVATLETLVPSETLARLIVRPGRTARVLADVADEMDADLVVLGGKHHSTLDRWLGGSTVRHAVRRLRVPLLVTTGEALPPHPRVLVAVDLSEAARPTIERARAFAALLDAPLRALHVVEPVPAAPEVALTVDMDQYEAQVRARLARDVWPLLPVPDHHKVVRAGLAAQTIAEEAAAWRADVIVVGSHGKGWVDRLLIGSVTEQLLDDLPAAVLVVPVLAPARERRTLPRALRAQVATPL